MFLAGDTLRSYSGCQSGHSEDLVLALRSELCSTGTGVTEKVTKTYHSFLGSSSPVVAGVREPRGHHELVPWIEW